MIIIKNNGILAIGSLQGINAITAIKYIVAQARPVQRCHITGTRNARTADIVGAVCCCAGLVSFKLQYIITGTARNGIAAFAARQCIGTITARNNIVAAAAIDGVIAITAAQRIGTIAAAKAVIACTAIKAVVADTTAQRIIAIATSQGIVTGTGVNRVIAVATAKGIVAIGGNIFHTVKGIGIQIGKGYTGQGDRSALRQGNNSIAVVIFTQIGLQQGPA